MVRTAGGARRIAGEKSAKAMERNGSPSSGKHKATPKSRPTGGHSRAPRNMSIPTWQKPITHFLLGGRRGEKSLPVMTGDSTPWASSDTTPSEDEDNISPKKITPRTWKHSVTQMFTDEQEIAGALQAGTSKMSVNGDEEQLEITHMDVDTEPTPATTSTNSDEGDSTDYETRTTSDMMQRIRDRAADANTSSSTPDNVSEAPSSRCTVGHELETGSSSCTLDLELDSVKITDPDESELSVPINKPEDEILPLVGENLGPATETKRLHDFTGLEAVETMAFEYYAETQAALKENLKAPLATLHRQTSRKFPGGNDSEYEPGPSPLRDDSDKENLSHGKKRVYSDDSSSDDISPKKLQKKTKK